MGSYVIFWFLGVVWNNPKATRESFKKPVERKIFLRRLEKSKSGTSLKKVERKELEKPDL